MLQHRSSPWLLVQAPRTTLRTYNRIATSLKLLAGSKHTYHNSNEATFLNRNTTRKPILLPANTHLICSSSFANITLALAPLQPRHRPSPLALLRSMDSKVRLTRAIMTTTQPRLHAGHGHHHHHDNTYLVSANKNDAGVRITRIGLYVNLCMAIGKGIGGYVFHSQALAADAVHSLTDLVADFMTLATVSWALKPPTSRFPQGYGKIESLGSLGVSGILLVGGLMMGWSSLIELCQIYLPSWAQFAEMVGIIGCGHNHTHVVPNIQAAWLAGGSVLVKEWLYRATMKVAKERKSAVLEANAVHHRVDSLTGIAALLSIAVANIFPTFAAMDALGGLVISYMIVKAGWSNTITSLYELADASVTDEVKTKTRNAAMAAVAESGELSAKVVRVEGTKAGQNYLMDVTVAIPGHVSVQQTAGVENAIRERVAKKVRGVRRVRVRFVVAGDDEGYDSQDEFVEPNSARSSPEPEEHDHGHGQNGNGVSNGELKKKL